MGGDAIVDVHDADRPLLALPERCRKGGIEEAVNLVEHRLVRRAGEAGALRVGAPQRQEDRRVEGDGVLGLLRARLLFGELPGHTNDLEAAVSKVVRLFGIEREDAEGQLLVRYEQRCHRTHPEPACGLEPIAPVGRPESIVGWHRDHRVEEQSGGADGVSQARGMCLREVALKRRCDDLLYGERRQNQRLSGKRVAIRPDDNATLLPDLLDEG